jgi:hypothetical protein
MLHADDLFFPEPVWIDLSPAPDGSKNQITQSLKLAQESLPNATRA